VTATRAPIVLEFASEIARPREDVWETVSTMDGVNAELGPFIRMSHPRDLPLLSTTTPTAGVVLFRSWVLLFGVLPFDRHALALDAVTDGAGFVEESTSWLQRRWRHVRTLSDTELGCLVSDQLTIEPRVAVTGPIVRVLVRAVFTHRHTRLRARFRRAGHGGEG
jgi:ligand-binding SRPBCC domain-containing protein